LGTRCHTDRSHAPQTVVDALLRASRALVAISARSLASVSEDVTLPQFRTLVMLANRGPQTVSSIAEGLDVHASTMTRMCNRLVNRGLVIRTPSATDRREVVVTLSTQGRQLVEDVTARRRRDLDAVVERMSPNDRAAVVTGLELFARAAGDDLDVGEPTPETLASAIRTISPFETSQED
jgi:DNA-binding MarR family transcriptional regulator